MCGIIWHTAAMQPPTHRIVNRAIDAVRRYRRLSHDALARILTEQTGRQISRSTVQAKCKGTTAITTDEAIEFAEALDTSPAIFYDGPDAAVEWTIQNDRDTARTLGGRSPAWLTADLVGAAN